MVVIGAGGLASEILPILTSSKYNFTKDNLFFFDNVSDLKSTLLFNEFTIYTTFEQLESHFKNVSTDFCFGFGGINLKLNIIEKLHQIGSKEKTVISKLTNLSTYGTSVGKGSVLIGNTNISSNVTIGENCLIYNHSNIPHDTIIGDFVEVAPHCSFGGRTIIKSNSSIGIGVITLPDIIIEENCIIGAGTIVTKNVPKNSIVKGNPNIITKKPNWNK